VKHKVRQPPDRLDPVPPLLDVKNGKMQEMRAAWHTGKDFMALLEGLVKCVRCAQD
jgi:hypothetical protein